MKIISTANIDGWTHKHICSTCDSQLEVDADDLKYKRYAGDARDPGYDTFTAACIVCDSSFIVPLNSIPKLIQIKIKRKQTPSGYYQDR